MTNEKIFIEAMNLLGEDPDAEINNDMRERASYLIAAFCNEMSELDKALRLAEAKDTEIEFDSTYLPLEDSFPLVSRLSSAACLYLASMLVIDENSELSDRLYDRYCDSISTICSNLPTTCEQIVDRYTF